MSMEYAKRHDGKWNLWRHHNQLDGDDTSRWEVIGVYDTEQMAYMAREKKTMRVYIPEVRIALQVPRDGEIFKVYGNRGT